MAALSLKGVRKSYDGKHFVLHGIDADIADGEFVVLVGPSGCGKSTLLRMIAGLESVSEGDIAIGGRVVNTLEPKDRDIAMVFQNYALYPHMSVRENMAYGLKIRGIDRAQIDGRVASAAKILELEPLLGRKPRELSGGQRQRVAMGRAIVREPAVFLFDEPLSNLDAKLRVQMRLEIQRLHARLATTSVYVTHDQVEAMTLAQRVIVMNGGRAEQIGAPTEVYERPATVFVAGFIGSPAMNLIEGRLADDGRTFEVAGGGPVLALADVPGVGREIACGRDWILGIRPEHMTPRAGPPQAPLVVESCELLGADNLAHGRWGRHDVTVRLPHAHRPVRQEVVSAVLPPEHLHFFDPTSGARAGLA
ncbi:sn-glycerol-3-phosphate import ATP-binding protein UgpC [Trinickia caryophylli]|uniref:Glycerol 3-phosphate ABC transporter ATP-binding protein n=1 Tax=Trinickia caryophylli TaxID=28094 RepID=A0A1X7F5V7_TRICW|nr:sn-glycerol-3-phosphate import ATP-binding protein UgpC [Trinickia caryophylli]PMS08693.1 sn-glycerol-3-phosphate import ATP-binding protein UgpC [Trinickia caryophylli]TRX19423.1 sn-glycerol-3-phosphate import ATP-binding protein UgpC [Trinickia caryophylli]WQE13272.1 sn-glycerol-3-phosphate import ATP-binding protein UgpC [Trinickia caryophylli]SMF45849.1 glycerol 3-phosphate ABC transporter ATP-binding protein [Trinickia caryophylli]GLU34409.1 sn-glycerol-3-phosphate import ATP-binding p